MDFKIVLDKNNDKFVWLKDIKLEQGLVTAYSVKDKKILILDEDEKDYRGSNYQNKIDAIIDDKEVSLGIVQKIDIEAIMAIAELSKVLRTL